MLTESDKKAASLAASRYGVDRARLEQICAKLLLAPADSDLLETLVRQNLLTRAQANELRLALDRTHLDTAARSDTTPQPRKKPAPDAVNVLPPGSVYELRTLGEYRILRPLGEGGMGSVFLGYHEAEKRHVALKLLPDHLADNPAYVDRFYREAKSGAQLDHPNIVRTLAVRRDPGTGQHYLVLEYVDGPSAHALLGRFGKLSVGDALHIVLDVARALEHAHSRNIVHRDIKPDNILLTQSGVAKLADLGLSKRTDEASHLTAARQGFGTPYYMPYEQATNAKFVDGRCDIYALGATLYHLLTGEVPFPGSSQVEIIEKKDLGTYTRASTLNPAIPPAVDRILGKMLARDPEDRYQTASELIVDLERSALAAPVPSFVDTDLALQDPLVRARLTAPAQPTRPDLDAPASTPATAEANPDVWYLRYRNRDGQWCKGRATTQQLVQRVREGRVAPTVEASHDPQGVYQPLLTYPEFRNVIPLPTRRKRATPSSATPAADPPARPAESPPPERPPTRQPWWRFFGATGLALLVTFVRWILCET